MLKYVGPSLSTIANTGQVTSLLDFRHKKGTHGNR